jgi:hypothetical protein
MGSKNGKPVLREEDVEDLARSSGLTKDEVSSMLLSAVLEGVDIATLKLITVILKALQ